MEQSVIQLFIRTTQLNDAFRKDLVGILTNYPGETPVSLLLSDGRTGRDILFLSKKYTVRITPELLSDLKSLDVDSRLVPSNAIGNHGKISL